MSTSAMRVAHRWQKKHYLKYGRFQGTGQKMIGLNSFPSSLPFASPSSRVHIGIVGATWDAGLQAWLPGVQAEALLLQSKGSARSSPSILPDQGCQQGSIRGKMVPLAPFQELDLDTEPILSYYFRKKSVVNPDQVLEKSVPHFKVSILPSYSKFGSHVVIVNKQPLALLLLFTVLLLFKGPGLHGAQQRVRIGRHLFPETYSLDLVIEKQETFSASPPTPIKVTVSSSFEDSVVTDRNKNHNKGHSQCLC